MATLQRAKSQIYDEITRESRSVRLEYVKRYSGEAAEFSEAMSAAMVTWLVVDFSRAGTTAERRRKADARPIRSTR